MNKIPLILIAIGLIFVVVGLLIDWRKSRKDNFETFLYMHFDNNTEPTLKACFTDKDGKPLESTEETDSESENRIWWVKVKPSPVPRSLFHLPINPKPKS